MANLVSKVTGKYNGEDVSFNVTHGNKSPSEMAAAVFLSLTGRTFKSYRGDYTLSQAGKRQYAFTFKTRRLNATLLISVL